MREALNPTKMSIETKASLPRQVFPFQPIDMNYYQNHPAPESLTTLAFAIPSVASFPLVDLTKPLW